MAPAAANAFKKAKSMELRKNSADADMAKVPAEANMLASSTYHGGKNKPPALGQGTSRSPPTSPKTRTSPSKTAGPDFVDERDAGERPRSMTAGTARSQSPGKRAAARRSVTEPDGWYRTLQNQDQPADGMAPLTSEARRRAQSAGPAGRTRSESKPSDAGAGYSGRRPGAKSDFAAAVRTRSEGGKEGTVLVRSPITGELQAVSRRSSAAEANAQKSIDMALRSDERKRGIPVESQKPRSRSKSKDGEEKRKIGAHYEHVCQDLFDNYNDADRAEHDAMLADSLTKLRPQDVPHPLLKEPRPPATAAFTDRSCRMREGRGAKGVLDHGCSASTDWFSYGECGCPVCKPETAKAAGAASHQVHYLKLCPSAQDHHPVSPDGKIHDNLNSELVATSLVHKVDGNSQNTPEEERHLRKNLGHKIKAADRGVRKTLEHGQATLMMPHRGFVDSTPAAGQFNQDYRPEINLGSKAPGFSAGPSVSACARSCSPVRSGAALCLSPRAEDPPAPTRITSSKKGEGQFKDKFSENTENSSVYHNQETLRYADPGTVRGRNTVTPDYESHAGQTTQSYVKQAERPLSQTPNPERQKLLNTSTAMTVLMDRELQQTWHKQERAERLKTEKPFSELCTTASEHRETQRTMLTTVRSMNGHHGPKLDLSWPGAEE